MPHALPRPWRVCRLPSASLAQPHRRLLCKLHATGQRRLQPPDAGGGGPAQRRAMPRPRCAMAGHARPRRQAGHVLKGIFPLARGSTSRHVLANLERGTVTGDARPILLWFAVAHGDRPVVRHVLADGDWLSDALAHPAPSPAVGPAAANNVAPAVGPTRSGISPAFGPARSGISPAFGVAPSIAGQGPTPVQARPVGWSRSLSGPQPVQVSRRLSQPFQVLRCLSGPQPFQVSRPPGEVLSRPPPPCTSEACGGPATVTAGAGRPRFPRSALAGAAFACPFLDRQGQKSQAPIPE